MVAEIIIYHDKVMHSIQRKTTVKQRPGSNQF